MKLSAYCLIAVLSMVLVGCQSEREKELEAKWAAAVKTDTIRGFVAFLAEQKKDEDAAVGEHAIDGDSGQKRSRAARRRMFELALERVKSACPFTSLGVELSQSISNVGPNFSLRSSSIGDSLRLMGISLDQPSQAGERLIMTLRGQGVEGRYKFLNGGPSGSMVIGGSVEGSIGLASRSDRVVRFKGSYRGGGLVTQAEVKYAATSFPKGLKRALESAGLTYLVAALIHDACSPSAGALVYFGDGVGQLCTSSETTDEALEQRMYRDYDKVSEVAIAAAFGSAGHKQCYDRSKKALRFIMRGPEGDKRQIAKAWLNQFYLEEIPNWLVTPEE